MVTRIRFRFRVLYLVFDPLHQSCRGEIIPRSVVMRVIAIFAALHVNAIEHQAEVLLLIKTAQSRFQELEREVRALHSYETPEIIALPVTASSAPYLEWLIDSVDPRS